MKRDTMLLDKMSKIDNLPIGRELDLEFTKIVWPDKWENMEILPYSGTFGYVQDIMDLLYERKLFLIIEKLNNGFVRVYVSKKNHNSISTSIRQTIAHAVVCATIKAFILMRD